ncbi:hypothetical protein WJX72_005634 [[Myrmecia] bisecta]|uniref:Uncharacterized protein n=1 Tax=[Myrmecia] bisecta TaxID=41462 RepID=A0AAW1PDN6_9CHLO
MPELQTVLKTGWLRSTMGVTYDRVRKRAPYKARLFLGVNCTTQAIILRLSLRPQPWTSLAALQGSTYWRHQKHRLAA